MELFNSIPASYKKGVTKYIIVTGSVMSGIGKGTLNSGLATLLKFYGLNVSMIKFDGYLNVDAGTLNPYRHGEVFVLEDGTETDLDLGTYERALHKNLSKHNYLTSGKIFKMIIEKERRGDYLGRDVQFIPHVTGEIKLFIRNLALKEKSDVIIIEVGGTIGDLENSYFLEAMRELKYEEGKENTVFINLGYIIDSNGEQKSKASQLGISKLMSLGITPDIIVCRSKENVTDSIKEKLSMISNIPSENVISFPNLKSIYHAPIFFKNQELGKKIFKILNISPKPDKVFIDKWNKFLQGLNNPNKNIKIAITGKYTELKDSYLSIMKALEHCEALLKTKIELKWIETTNINSEKQVEENLKEINGIIIPGGFGSRGTEGKILFIKHAREKNIPFLGLCYGMQLAVIEYARNVCNIKNANSTEIEKTSNPVVSLLSEQENINDKGATMRLGSHKTIIKNNTRAASIYKKPVINERFRHRYEINKNYIKNLEEKGLVFSGISADDKHIMQILELPKSKHKFFFATQFHPELTSRPLTPNPVFIEFIKSCLNN